MRENLKILSLCNLAFSVFFALLVLAQAFYIPSQVISNLDKKEQQQTEEGSKKADVTVIQADAIPNSSSQINVAFISYLLDVVIFQEEEGNHPKREFISPSNGKVVKVLFRKIISPNAP